MKFGMRSLLFLFLASVLFTGLGFTQTLKLTLLHNNDGESQLVNAGDGNLEAYGGVARFKTVVDSLRARSSRMGSEVILVSSGDNFLAGKEWNASLNRGEELPYFDAVAMDSLDYDAVAIGNHDFDFGPDVLEKFISDYEDNQPVYLSANLDFTNESGLKALEDAGRIAKSTVIERDGRKIGIIGAVYQDLKFISSPRNTIINDVKTAVEAEVADLRDNQDVDIIILISHLQNISEDTLLAKELSDIDIIVAGGGDNILANEGDSLVPGDVREFSYPYVATDKDGNDVYIVTTGGEYRYVGNLMVEFDANGNVIGVNEDSGPVRVDDTWVQNSGLKAEVVDPVANFVSALNANVIGQTAVPLDGIRNNIRAKETNLGNLVADAILWTGQQQAAAFGVKSPEVALQNGGGIRNSSVIPAGNFTEGMTYDILAFTNYVSVVEDIPAAQFKEIMENGVALLPANGGQFGQIAGFSMVVDPMRTAQVLEGDNRTVVTAGERVRELVLDNGTVIVKNGVVADGAPAVTMATIDFLVSQNGDGYPFRGIDFERVGVTYQQALYNYVVDELDGSISAADYPEGGEGRIISTLAPLPVAKARLRADGTPIAVKGVMTSTDHGFNDGTYFVQDANGGIYVFHKGVGGEGGTPIDYDMGDTLLITGVIDIFSGIVELAANEVKLVAKGDQLPDPIEITVDDLAVDSKYQGMRVKLAGVTVTGTNWPTEPQTSSSGRNVTATAASTPFIIRIDRGQSFYDGSPKPVGEFTLLGTLHRFNADVQLMPFFKGDVRTKAKLALLHNNDGESQLVNAGTGNLSGFGGVARFKSAVDTLRAHAKEEGRTHLLLSSGDNFLAGKEWNASLNRAEGLPYYDAVAMDKLDYDAVSFGNHDFDFGPDVLAKFISDYTVNQPPYLGANLNFENEPGMKELEVAGRIAKSVVIEKDGQEFGVIGAVYENLRFISSPRNTIIGAVKPAIEAEVAKLKAMGVNKIILISHLQDVSEDTLLANELMDIDIMVAGGGDNILANEGDSLVPGDVREGSYPLVVKDQAGKNVYVVTTGGDYRYLGNLLADFDEDGQVVAIADHSSAVRIDNRFPENQDMKETVVDPVVEFVAGLESNVIATTDVPLDGIRNNIRSRETNLGNLVADAILWTGKEKAGEFNKKMPQVALQNGGGIRNGSVIAAGNFTEGMTYDILAFTNYVSIIEDIPAAQFKELMENAVAKYPSPAGQFGQIAGFRMVIDSTGTPQVLDLTNPALPVLTPGTRVRKITLDDGTIVVNNGAVVQNAQPVTMATIDFLVSQNGDGYPFRGVPFTTVGVTYQQALYNYVVDHLEGSISGTDYPQGGEGRIEIRSIVSVEEEAEIPATFSMDQNYPNPFNPVTNIRFGLPEASDVTLKVYDITGREVMTVLNNVRKNAGYHILQFNGSNLASGVYFYQILAGSNKDVKKLVLLK